MEKIIVEVDDNAAKKWRFASVQKRSEITNTINLILEKSLSKSDDDFWLFLDSVSKRAKDKGLTEEALNNLLNE